jgi:hypothetical protein
MLDSRPLRYPGPLRATVTVSARPIPRATDFRVPTPDFLAAAVLFFSFRVPSFAFCVVATALRNASPNREPGARSGEL